MVVYITIICFENGSEHYLNISPTLVYLFSK